MPSQINAVILGAGPAGLACCYELARRKVPAVLIEQNGRVGGLCRTLEYQGNLFDIGGHRFYSKSEEINALWKNILKDELRTVERRSSIFYKNRFLDYPLDPVNALSCVGLYDSFLFLSSFLYAKWFGRYNESSFEGWMTKRFGKRLYDAFFRAYTEKVWGIPCSELSSDWAVQRVQKFSLGKAIWKAFGAGGFTEEEAGFKTLTRKFLYPRLGPGQFCDQFAAESARLGASILVDTAVQEIGWKDGRITHVLVQNKNGTMDAIRTSQVCSTIPLTSFISKLNPAPPADVVSACANLRYRHFITVNLIYDAAALFDEQWLYVHSPGVRLGRVQNYKNWSPDMVAKSSQTTLGAEYFSGDDDPLWQMNNQELLDLAVNELDLLRIADRRCFSGGFVVRVKNAYPIYLGNYQTSLGTIRSFLEPIQNLQLAGRAGMFRYNNSDHALLTGLYAARNFLGESHDLWNVNTEDDYLEHQKEALTVNNQEPFVL